MARGPENGDVTFELERFGWAAPDRLVLAGRFVGLPAPPPGAPVLTVHGAKRVHRLPAASSDPIAASGDGRPWRAEFAWQEAPEAFSTVRLQFGRDLSVELPPPGDGAPRSLPVQRQPSPADRVRAESELLAAREEAAELRAAAEQARAELARARADLEAERERRVADAQRFRDGLAAVQHSAEAALQESEEALRARDAAVEELRAELAAIPKLRSLAGEARTEAERVLARLTAMRDELGD